MSRYWVKTYINQRSGENTLAISPRILRGPQITPFMGHLPDPKTYYRKVLFVQAEVTPELPVSGF